MDLSSAVKRRRGAGLEAALLDAAWAELAELGYAGMTFEGVARRAETSRSVVYRRWATKPELVLAALRRYYDTHPIVMPDTGSLRDDTVALLREVSDKRFDVLAVFTIRLGAFFEETGTSLVDLRRMLLGSTRSSGGMMRLLERAAARGEIDLAAIGPRVATVPVDLLRNELLLTEGAISVATIESIVDEVFLPLVARRSKD